MLNEATRREMRQDADMLRSTNRNAETSMSRVEAFERLFTHLPTLINELERSEGELAEARAAIEQAREVLTDARAGWQTEHEFHQERYERKGYSHDEATAEAYGNAVLIVDEALAALDAPQRPEDTEEDTQWRRDEREIDGGFAGSELPRLWPPRQHPAPQRPEDTREETGRG